MGLYTTKRVMVSSFGIIIFASLFAWTAASVCEKGKTYHDSNLQQCLNCTVCKKGEVVIRPCEIHRDTHCGVLNLKDILKFITPDSTVSQNPHRHHKHKKHRQKIHDDDIIWRYGDDVAKMNEHSLETPADVELHVAPLVSSTEAPFSNAETLVWDWQAIALSTAVFTCILFFLVITLYSLHQAKQWRRLKENFEADVEELSASLMAAAAASQSKNDVEKGDERVSETTMKSKLGSDGNYLNRCVYMEQLLNVRRDNKNRESRVGGNVYIAPKIPPKS